MLDLARLARGVDSFYPNLVQPMGESDLGRAGPVPVRVGGPAQLTSLGKGVTTFDSRGETRYNQRMINESDVNQIGTRS